ncbi:BatA domain-containing protein [Sunxiuqinia dokdonensis]|uniref:Aerotolerance regulator N-terminal domain-containing protein n=1 Tax=Sunxiuqinia dokdonensis TaxID=1409788 RepID=A0A0L8VC17_9BACT|nr:BatA domain-containing protein [Sunxiuqinia dokdonensis]KOH46030.1 hypothetical protein NC99_11600 [Sunxiuqinia dokdonensis]
MRFIYPEFLPALVFISIPILIHFLHFKRYKTVYFSQVSFLKAIKEETKKKSNLKQLLILISRILAIVALVFVFAQPYLPTNKQDRTSARKVVGVYIDNSFSMKNESENGLLLEQAKNKAISIANSYGPGTSFLLLTNQNLPEQQQLLNPSQLISQLGTVRENPASISLSNAHSLLRNNLIKQQVKSEKIIYLISDFQAHWTDFSEMENDSNFQTFLIPIGSPTSNNLLIDSCWFETPGRKKNREEKLFARIQNRSNQNYQNIPIRLKINDTIKAINNISIEAEKSQVLELVYKNSRTGTHRGLVELDDYPIVYDNQFFFSYEVRDKNRVLAISEANDPAVDKLQALFLNDENIDFEKTTDKQTQISQFQNFQCIYLLNLDELSSGLISALSQFVRGGGSLALFPGANANIDSYNELFGRLHTNLILGTDSSTLRMESVSYRHPLMEQVFLNEKTNLELPVVRSSYRFSSTIESTQSQVVGFNNRQPAVSDFQSGLGRLVSFSFPLDEEITDFSRQAIFVPLVYNIALNSFDPQEIQYEIASNLTLTLPANESVATGTNMTIKALDSDESIQVPVMNQYANQVRIDLHNIISQAGFYQLRLNEDETKTLAFNFNRQESLSPQLTATQLQQALEQTNQQTFNLVDGNEANFAAQLQEANDGVELWKLFLALCLLFLAAEIAISRFWK